MREKMELKVGEYGKHLFEAMVGVDKVTGSGTPTW